jgi:hypothetical protein
MDPRRCHKAATPLLAFAAHLELIDLAQLERVALCEWLGLNHIGTRELTRAVKNELLAATVPLNVIWPGSTHPSPGGWVNPTVFASMAVVESCRALIGKIHFNQIKQLRL